MDWKKFLIDWLDAIADQSLRERLLGSRVCAVTNWAYYSGIAECGGQGNKRLMKRQMECAVGGATFAKLLGIEQ